MNLFFFFKPAAFDWGPGTIAALDSSFFWGYLVTQVPGGYLAAKFPANKYLQFVYIYNPFIRKSVCSISFIFHFRVFGIALAISACLNCLLPTAAKINFVVAMFVRILQGLVEVIIVYF